MDTSPKFHSCLRRWGLIPDGGLIITPRARLLPVLRGNDSAMLKLSLDKDERLGAAVMAWWEGQGAARVIARDDTFLLLERAAHSTSLADMARAGRDDEACQILCTVANQLHEPRPRPYPELIPLERWFKELTSAGAQHGGILAHCADTARNLLNTPRDCRVLHGDLHHGNVLDFGKRGWLAIDPKGLFGERGFDFANIFTNPDLADPTQPLAIDPTRFEQRMDIVTNAAGLEPKRLLQWILAWTGLSASWLMGEDDALVAVDLHVAELANAALNQ